MAEQLSVIGIIVFRKCGELFCLPDIVIHCRRIQKIFVQDRVSPYIVFTHFHNAECVLQQSSGKSMMNTFCSRVCLKPFDKCRIIFEIIFHCFSLLIHSLDTLLACRHVVCRHIFIFKCLADLLDIQLKIAIIADDVSEYFDKIHLIIVCDSIGIRIPHLSIQSSCLIL